MPNDLDAYRVGPLKRRHPGKSHYLVQFSSSPSGEQVEALRRRGATIVNYVPDAALVVAAEDDMSWDGLELRYVSRLDTLDKVSENLPADQTTDSAVVVEFHRDVDMDEARALVRERNLQIDERSNLLPYQLLVEGPVADILRLPEWDEVAYVFPASPELINGDDVRPCAGPITEQGPVAQYVLGSAGWPATGAKGSPVALKYAFGTLTSKIPASLVQSEIIRAMNEWTKVTNVRFSLSKNATGKRTINIFFASYAHNDGLSFDGPGGVLAHTFLPDPPNPEPRAGDIHLDADESWQAGSFVDLFSVALHETGHALGLAHSNDPSSVMYPFYKLTTTLTADDITGIQKIYGPPQK
jgi:hypothetical protein